MKKRLFAVLCAAALMLGLLLQAGAAKGDWDENVIFLAINDSPMPLTDSTMPIRIGGTIYVPYTVFDANQNGGVRLGVFNGGMDKVKNTLTLYNSEPKNLTFDLKTGISYDYLPDGERQTPTAVIRNGQIYVSASSTCTYFEIKCVQSNITFENNKSYTYIRIRTAEKGSAMEDAAFKSSAMNSFLMKLQDYYWSVMGQTSDPGGVTPSPAVSPEVTPEGGQDRRGVQVYLALRCDTGASGAAMLDSLERSGGGALLLFPVDSLARQDDLIRRAVGEGHMIGLITAETSAERARDELERGNGLLAHIARTSTRVVLAEDPEVAGALKADGWLCWQDNITALPGERGSAAVYAALDLQLKARERTARITLDDSETSSTVLSRLLRTLREDQYDLRLAVETEF